MNRNVYKMQQNRYAEELLREKFSGKCIDNDIWNLKWMLTQIHPYSRNWQNGCIRSLRRAIKALERENEMNTQK